MNIFDKMAYFQQAVKLEVDSINDVPKFTEAMRAFGWFESANEIDNDWMRIIEMCKKEYAIVDNAETS